MPKEIKRHHLANCHLAQFSRAPEDNLIAQVKPSTFIFDRGTEQRYFLVRWLFFQRDSKSSFLDKWKSTCCPCPTPARETLQKQSLFLEQDPTFGMQLEFIGIKSIILALSLVKNLYQRPGKGYSNFEGVRCRKLLITACQNWRYHSIPLSYLKIRIY